MTTVDYDNIMDYKDRLKKHEGFLPLLVRCVMMDQHSKTLKKAGIYDEVISEEIRTRPSTLEKATEELVEWCEKHPEYKDLIR